MNSISGVNDIKMLAGSLSNDLLRVAGLVQRGSTKAAARFLREAKRWSVDLEKTDAKEYILKIARDISERDDTDLAEASAERYLMYGVLLQNYCLHV